MIEIKGKYNEAKIFTDVVDSASIAQVQELCNQEFTAGSRIRLMPDIHAGAGCTIGTTMTITDKVVPNLVGVDIGCGMETTRIREGRLELQKLDKLIYEKIPSGFSIRDKAHRYLNEIDLSELCCARHVDLLRAEKSIGTLGGGNHFIEVDKDDEGNLYIVVHSGSRHLGVEVASYYGAIASRYYGYKVSVIDLRNPTRSDGFNFLTLMNHYMDIARKHPENLAARARAEKYAKILAKTIINPDGDAAQYGENAFFYDSAEGLLTAIVLLLAEFAPPKDGEPEKRHIVSAFKLVQDLLAVPKSRGKNGFQVLMDELPPEHKARWLAGAALTSADQSMASVMSTVMSRLNAFLDTELEQVICYDSPINAEMFASEKCAIFLILPEEDPAKNFIAALMIQNLSRELFSVADEHDGRLKNRVVLFCDELGTMPPFDILPLFSAGRSRRLTLVPIIQSLAQLEKNYGKEGAEIICDNCQDTIFGGFSPQSKTADALSAALGSRTVLSGSVSQGKESSQSLQMMERALMTPDELKSIPKGEFVVMKTGTHPMRTKLRLFLDWGITFDPYGYRMPERAARKIAYIDQGELIRSIHRSCIKNPYNMEGSR